MTKSMFNCKSAALCVFLGGLMLTGFAPAAFAESGTSSGPATGGAAVPNTAPAASGQSGQNGQGSAAGQGNVGAGAAGVAAQPNTESGPASTPKSSGQSQ